jgi:hypothetical protein
VEPARPAEVDDLAAWQRRRKEPPRHPQRASEFARLASAVGLFLRRCHGVYLLQEQRNFQRASSGRGMGRRVATTPKLFLAFIVAGIILLIAVFIFAVFTL